jgi:hypothetical protein
MIRSKKGIAAALIILLSMSAHGQQTTTSQQDLNSAEQRYSDSKVFSPKEGLHASTYKFADGAKGVKTNVVPEAGVVMAHSKFATNADAAMFNLYCTSASIVSATNISNISRLSQDKRTIYTVSTFRVDDAIKPYSGISTGAVVSVDRLGGEVVDDGETLRFDTGEPAFKPSKSYLLLLWHTADQSPLHFFTSDHQTMSIRDGRIYPSVSTDFNIFPGSSYKDVKAKFAQVQNVQPCP